MCALQAIQQPPDSFGGHCVLRLTGENSTFLEKKGKGKFCLSSSNLSQEFWLCRGSPGAENGTMTWSNSCGPESPGDEKKGGITAPAAGAKGREGTHKGCGPLLQLLVAGAMHKYPPPVQKRHWSLSQSSAHWLAWSLSRWLQTGFLQGMWRIKMREKGLVGNKKASACTLWGRSARGEGWAASCG